MNRPGGGWCFNMVHRLQQGAKGTSRCLRARTLLLTILMQRDLPVVAECSF